MKYLIIHLHFYYLLFLNIFLLILIKILIRITWISKIILLFWLDPFFFKLQLPNKIILYFILKNSHPDTVFLEDYCLLYIQSKKCLRYYIKIDRPNNKNYIFHFFFSKLLYYQSYLHIIMENIKLNYGLNLLLFN